MQAEAQEFLYVVNLKKAADVDIESGLNEYSWEEFKESLLTHRVRGQKDGVGFMPVMPKHESEWQEVISKSGERHFRGDVNIEAITALVMDMDKPGALEHAEKVFEGYEYVAHSTHNFTPETPWKYRMIVRLAEPIHVDNWPICFEALKSRINLDVVCCNPSRFYYYPSHSKHSNISPRAYHKPGKALTLNEILDLATDKEVLHQTQFRKVKVRPESYEKRVLKKRHFSGAVVGRYDAVSDEIDMSMNAMLDRHIKSLQEYEFDGSNHNLALTITAREIVMHGPKIDLKATILFIFKIAAERGRPIESGNTANELPGMIINGMVNYAPECYEQIVSDQGDNVEAYLASIIRWVSINYQDAYLNQKDLSKDKAERDEANYYKVIRERHKPFLVEYVATGDLRRLVNQIMHAELKLEKPKYDEIAKALVNYQFGYHSKVEKKTDLSAWQSVNANLPSLARYMNDKNISAPAQKINFARSAVLIESSKRIPAEIRKQDQPGLSM